MRVFAFLFLTTVFFGYAQHPSGGAGGILPEWDVKANMTRLVADIRRIDPLLQKVNPADWVQRGAPEAYVRQLQSSKNSVQNLIASTDALAQDPDRLTVALDAFFRMEKMEVLLGSLKEGVRKYQSPAVADELTTLLASNSVHRERLQAHITELAAAREEEFRVVDQEAQRCRAVLSRQGLNAKPDEGKNRKERK